MKNVTTLGTHKGISLIEKENGDQFYYSTKTGKTAIGVKGLARLLDINKSSVYKAGVSLNCLKDLQMYTQNPQRLTTPSMQPKKRLLTC